MATEFKFPNGGHSVTILRKEDVLKTIDENIIVKDIALTIVRQLEIDAGNCIKIGGWAGIPHFGNLRVPPSSKMYKDEAVKKLIEAQKETLDNKGYILFRKDLAAEIKEKEKLQRIFNYRLSKMVKRNYRAYTKMAKEKGDTYANLYFFLLGGMKVLGSEELLYGYGCK